MPQGFHKYVVFLSTCTVIAWYLNIFQSKYPKKLFTRGMIFWFLNHWDARKLVPFWILPSQLANFRASKMESKSFFPFIIITFMSLVAHRFGHVEFWVPCARHYNNSWILTIHKARILRKKAPWKNIFGLQKVGKKYTNRGL